MHAAQIQITNKGQEVCNQTSGAGAGEAFWGLRDNTRVGGFLFGQ